MEKEKSTVLKTWVLVIQLGLTAIAPIILCVALGVYLKTYQGIDMLLLLSVLGILAGATGAWRMAFRYVGKDDEGTRIVSGIYDHEDTGVDTEDALLEEYKRNNEEREKLLNAAARQEESHD